MSRRRLLGTPSSPWSSVASSFERTPGRHPVSPCEYRRAFTSSSAVDLPSSRLTRSMSSSRCQRWRDRRSTSSRRLTDRENGCSGRWRWLGGRESSNSTSRVCGSCIHSCRRSATSRRPSGSAAPVHRALAGVVSDVEERAVIWRSRSTVLTPPSRPRSRPWPAPGRRPRGHRCRRGTLRAGRRVDTRRSTARSAEALAVSALPPPRRRGR